MSSIKRRRRRWVRYAWASPNSVLGVGIGTLFLPAYLLPRLAQLLRGGRPYRDDAFERAAYGGRGDRSGC